MDSFQIEVDFPGKGKNVFNVKATCDDEYAHRAVYDILLEEGVLGSIYLDDDCHTWKNIEKKDPTMAEMETMFTDEDAEHIGKAIEAHEC